MLPLSDFTRGVKRAKSQSRSAFSKSLDRAGALGAGAVEDHVYVPHRMGRRQHQRLHSSTSDTSIGTNRASTYSRSMSPIILWRRLCSGPWRYLRAFPSEE